ncbi:MAG TPA: hypothetical protein VMU19_08805 [Bryobacteraceae bacterium]|nr:hypothetical protein [Bryobacteraceae bacterium]
MQLYWILSPITQYGFMALALAACLALFLSMKKEIAMASSGSRDSAATVAALAAEVASIRQEMTTVEPRSYAGQKLNLTRRAQALRMERRGEAPATIAATLRVPRNEVDLLLKIQKLSERRTSAHESPTVEAEPRA